MAKLTEEELRKLVQEEIGNLSEEEINELLPFAGIGKGIAQATKGAVKGYRKGRADAVKAKLQKKYGKQIAILKNNATKLAASATKEIERQKKIYKDELKGSKSLDAILNNLTAIVTDLSDIEKAFSARERAVSEEDNAGGEE
jgi:hypothetical protein